MGRYRYTNTDLSNVGFVVVDNDSDDVARFLS